MPLRLVLVIGLAVALWVGAGTFAPAQAFALEASVTALGPEACEDAAAALLAEPALAENGSCVMFDDDDLPAALCWEDGSAGVAPPPSFPIAPDKIEGIKVCPFEGVGIGSAFPGRSGDHHPAFPTIEATEPALMPGLALPTRSSFLVVIPTTPYRLVDAEGVRPRLDRPPT
ncbi:MAG: hypothetical protein HOV80_09485 [Polyangiaceae bacterium]|nr:hypothetical protein [Polyangiaceae bacterium]